MHSSVQDASAEASGQAIVEFAAGSRQRQRSPTIDSLEGQQDAFSALDGLWALLRRADELRAEHPKLLAAVLSAIVSLWQVEALPRCRGEVAGADPGARSLKSSHVDTGDHPTSALCAVVSSCTVACTLSASFHPARAHETPATVFERTCHRGTPVAQLHSQRRRHATLRRGLSSC